MNLLLDTNVYIDFLGRKEPFYPAAMRIAAAGYFGDCRLWVAAQSINDAFYVLSRYVDATRVQQTIGKSFQIIAPVSLSLADYEHAVRLSWPDMEDCLVAIAAEKVRADYLITRDVKGFDRSMVPVIAPDQWLALMRGRGIEYDGVPLGETS